jgi:hypothetical protein
VRGLLNNGEAAENQVKVKSSFPEKVSKIRKSYFTHFF